MFNNKAFTLVELLGVIALISTILIIIIPNFTTLTKSAKSEYDNSIKMISINAAKLYVNNNKTEIENFFVNNPSSTYCIPLAKLAAYDYIDSDLKDSNNNEIDMKRCVNITKKLENEKIKYNYELSNDNISDDIDYLPPILSIVSKDSNIFNCTESMHISIDEFNQYCSIIATDDIDTTIDIVYQIKQMNNGVIIIYTSTDSSGNKSKELKIKLVN